MFDIGAISANHGWEYAALGVSIVFTGLILLATAISQLHKLLTFWDNRGAFLENLQKKLASKEQPSEDDMPEPDITGDVKESAKDYKILIDWLGEPFALPKLLEAAIKSGLYCPHAAINDLIRAGLIQPDDKGYYIWR